MTTTPAVPRVRPWLLVALFLSVLVTGSYYAWGVLSALDRQAVAAQADRIEAALAVEERRLADLNNEYAFWDETYERLVLDRQLNWANDYIGTYQTDTYGVELSVVIPPQGPPQVGFLDGRLVTVAGESLRPVAETASDLVRELLAERNSTTGALSLNGDLYLFAASRLISEKTVQPRADGSALVTGWRLSEAYLERLSLTYRLPAMRLSRGAVAADGAVLSLTDAAGGPAWSLQWTAERPALALTRQLLLPAVALVVLVLLIGGYLVRRDRRMQQRFDEQIRAVADRDFATGLLRRAEFAATVRRRREGTAAAAGGRLLLIDLDRSDAPSGLSELDSIEERLVNLAGLLRERSGEDAVVGRWSGTRLTVFLPAATLRSGLDVAEGLRRTVEARGRGLDVQARLGTISIAGAVCRDDEDVEGLVARAARVLVTLRESGGNQTRIAP